MFKLQGKMLSKHLEVYDWLANINSGRAGALFMYLQIL